MVRCGFSRFVTDCCGQTLASSECVSLSQCTRDIKPHLKGFNVYDASIKNESQLLLARAAICRECRKKVKDISLEITSSNHEKKGAIATGSKDENRGLIAKIKERQLEHGIDKESDDRGSTDQCVVSVNYGGDGECIRSGDVVCGRGIDEDGSVGEAVGDDDDDDDENAGGAGVDNGDDGAIVSEIGIDISEGVSYDYGDGVGGELAVGGDFDYGGSGGDSNKAEVEVDSDVNNDDVHSGGDDDKIGLSACQSHGSDGDGDGGADKFDSDHDTSVDYTVETTFVFSPEETERVTSTVRDTKERKSVMADIERDHVVSFRKQELNDFLTKCGVSSVRDVDMGLPTATERTRRRNISEASEVMVTILQTLSPSHPGELWKILKDAGTIDEKLHVCYSAKGNESDMKYLIALSETYNNASSGNARKQILSIMADLATLEEIRQFIPGLTKYMFCEARMHLLLSGRGAPVVSNSGPRCKIDLKKLDHFLSFITSPYVIQDLPFGEKFLKLSSGEVVQTPNVIRVSFNERIINQYLQCCKESGRDPLSRSTLRRILTACRASTRKSLQGLDYFVSEGSKAFDDLHELINKLAGCGLEIKAIQNIQMKLKEGKSYLKIDFKVSVYFA
ncbi:hypothetical protein ACROYT_G027439 [Oculina patagonica]